MLQYRVRMSNLPNLPYWEKKADNACNALKYQKDWKINKIYNIPEQNTNYSGNFSESICPELFFKKVPFWMSWEMMSPSMTAVGDGLQKKLV